MQPRDIFIRLQCIVFVHIWLRLLSQGAHLAISCARSELSVCVVKGLRERKTGADHLLGLGQNLKSLLTKSEVDNHHCLSHSLMAPTCYPLLITAII